MTIVSWDNVDFGNDIDIKVLAQNSATKEIQITMPKDSTMKEHKAPFDINVQVLCGKIWFEIGQDRLEMNTLDMISVEGGVPHSLGGLENSIIRLSLSKQDSKERVDSVLKG